MAQITKDEALKQALEALEIVRPMENPEPAVESALIAIRQALEEQPEQIAESYAKGLDDGAADFERIVLPAAIAAEREACAKLCEAEDGSPYATKHAAANIRARGQK